MADGDSSGSGLLGNGTVGAAFAELLPRHADRIQRITGLRPELSGVLTRSRGSFEEILAGSDLIVELIGGLEPAREYLLPAMRAGRHVVTANKQLLSHHGEELWEAARVQRVQLRFEGAVAGVIPVIRVLQESLAGRRRRPGPRHRQRHHQLHPHRDGAHRRHLRAGAGRRPAARLRRGRPVRRRLRPRRRRQDGDHRPPGVRDAGPHRPGQLRGRRADPARRPRVRARPGPGAQADRHRRAGRRPASRSASIRPSCTPATR